MMINSINKLAKANPTLARAGGFLLGYLAASPFKHPFAALTTLGLFGEYFRQKKIDTAEQAARDAAIEVGKTDPACRNLSSPTCVAHAKAAAIAAGEAAMGPRRTMSWPVIVWLSFLAAVAIGMIFVPLSK